MKSIKGTIIAIVVIGALLIGIYFYDQAQNRIRMEEIKQAVEEANKPLQDGIQELINEIRQDRYE